MKKEQFPEFLKANEKRIYNYLLSLLGDESDANDVAQMVFLSFYEHIDNIDESTALSYLYRIAHNKSMTYLKQKNRYVNFEPKSFEQMQDRNIKGNDKDYSLLHTAIKELPPRLASVIQLQYFDKLSYKEIAEKLGVSVKAVESLLVRAKKRLRKNLMKDRKEDIMIASERLRALVRYNIYNDFINDILDDNQYRFYLDILLDIADRYNLDEIKDKYHTITQIIKWFRMNMAVELPELDNFSVAYLVGNELESGFYTMNDKGLWIKTQLRFSYPLTFTQGINITEYIYKARTYDSKFYLIQISGPICAVISKEGIIADLILHPRIDNLSDDIYFKEKLVNVIEEIWYLIKYNKNIGDNNELQLD